MVHIRRPSSCRYRYDIRIGASTGMRNCSTSLICSNPNGSFPGQQAQEKSSPRAVSLDGAAGSSCLAVKHAMCPFITLQYGSSMCPGRHLADANIWLAIASILSVFRISNTKDKNGNPIKPDIEHETGLVRFVNITEKRPNKVREPALTRSLVL